MSSWSARAAVHGAQPAHELDARRLAHALRAAKEQRADFGGGAHVRAAARTLVELLDRDDAELALARRRLAEAGDGGGALVGDVHIVRHRDRGIRDLLGRDERLLRDCFAIEIERG